MKRVGTGLVAAAVISGVVAAGATGHAVKYDSTVTAKFDKQAKIFDGAVASAKRGCAKNRSVTLRLRAADGSSTVAGTDVTDALGAWVVASTSDPVPGTYFAETAKKVIRKNENHRHVCAPAVSKDIKVK